MEKNCLIETLKGTIENNSLPKLGELNILVTPSANNVKNISTLLMASIGDSVIEATDGGYYGFDWDTLDSVHQTEGNTPTSTTTIYVKNDSFHLKISNKYNLKSLQMAVSSIPQRIKIDMTNLEYCVNIDNLVLYSPVGNIKSLAYLPKLVVCTVEDTIGSIDSLSGLSYLRNLTLKGAITGSLASLGSITTLETVDFGTAEVNIEINDFVGAQYIAGRTSKETPFTIQSSRVKFGGIESGYTYNWVTWNGTSKIVVYCASGGTYTNAPKIMAKGATAEEIAAWEQAGKTVVVIP